MKTLARHLGRFLLDEDGPTAVEYAVMLALILMACFAVVVTFGRAVSRSFSNAVSVIGS